MVADGREVIDEGRRGTIKLLGLAALLSAIRVVEVDRSEFMKMLQRVDPRDIIGDKESLAPPSASTGRVAEKERMLKSLCMKAAEALCSQRGRDSAECREALSRCEKIRVTSEPARKGVRFAMAIDVDKCIGCRRCVYACAMENNVQKNAGMEWIKVLEVDREGAPELEGARDDYTVAPKPGKVYVPVACQHCENPPCVMVCPVRATWKEEDGIVVIDYDRCIGCKYCIVACPYGARRFNLLPPSIDPLELNPNMHLLGNVPRPVHVVEKCTWCIQRTRKGGVPACVEACPVGARSFGDLNNPESPIRRIIEEYGVFVLKPETGTKPRLFYYFSGAKTPRRKLEG